MFPYRKVDKVAVYKGIRIDGVIDKDNNAVIRPKLIVLVDDKGNGTKWRELPLEPSLKLVNHSPDGFEWGYPGSGPAQLALAILLHHFSQDPNVVPEYRKALAIALHQPFKRAYIERLPREAGTWTLTTTELNDLISAMPTPKRERLEQLALIYDGRNYRRVKRKKVQQ